MDIFSDKYKDPKIRQAKIDGLISIIRAGTKENLGLPDDRITYYLTQAAVWYHLDGIKPEKDGNGNREDGITQGFYDWIQKNYKEQWNALMKDSFNDFQQEEYYLNIVGDSEKLKEIDGYGEYLFSDDFSIASNIKDKSFTVKLDDEYENDACIVYDIKDTDCKSRLNINDKKTFKIRTKKPGDASGTAKASFSVEPTYESKKYSLITYGGLFHQGYQNVAIVKETPVPLSASRVVSGEYTNTTSVNIEKRDSETDNKVAGAELAIYDEKGALINKYISTGVREGNPSISLPVGKYTLKETKAPEGYILSTESVDFEVVDENGVLKVKQAGEIVNNATITIKNNPTLIKFRKVDSDGNPVEGVKFTITDSTSAGAGNLNVRLCAYTDENGLLTVPCDSSEYEFKAETYTEVKKDGIYRLGIDFGSSESIYTIEEEVDENSIYKYDVDSFNNAHDFDFHIENGVVTTFNRYINVSSDTTDDSMPLIVMTMVNNGYIDISKTDITTGAEIGGAKLTVYDPQMFGDDDAEIASWESIEGKSHRITGLKFDKFYALQEEIAPKGYVSMATTIWFKLSEDGTVSTYAPGGRVAINDVAGSNYKLLVTNDYTKVNISKTDMVTGEEVPGAELKICTAESYKKSGNDCDPGKKEWSWVSGTEPHNIDRLASGDYYLIETVAPAGYVKKTSAVNFTVEEVTGVQQVEFTNQPTKVTISKLNQVTGEKLEGAHFEILKASDRSPVVDENGNKLEWISKKDESWEIYALPAGKYILVETSTPEGYQEGMVIDGEVVNEYKFTVSDQEGDVNIDVYIEVMNVPNTGLSSINIIAIGCLMIFIGYQVMKLYRRRLS